MRHALTLIAVLIVAGCASSPSTNFFVLSPSAPEHPTRTVTGAPLVVDSVRIPDYLDRPQIVRRLGPNRIDISTFNHWGSPLGPMIRDTLIQDLESRLPNGLIVRTDQSPTAGNSRLLTVTIHDFTAGPSGTVTLDADWSAGPRNGQATLCDHDTIAVRMKAAAPSAEAEGMSKALGTLADHITTALSQPRTASRYRCPVEGK